MKASHYVLNDLEHTDLAAAKTVKEGKDEKVLPPTLHLVDAGEVDRKTFLEALQAAGVDKYVGGVAVGELRRDWKGHARGSLVVRFVTSAGYNVTVCDCDVEGDALTPPPAPRPTPTGAELGQRELEQQRQEQAAADEARRKAAAAASSTSSSSTPSTSSPAAANDNQEPGAPAAPTNKTA